MADTNKPQNPNRNEADRQSGGSSNKQNQQQRQQGGTTSTGSKDFGGMNRQQK